MRSLIGWMLDEGWKHPTFSDRTFILLAAHDARQARIPYEFVCGVTLKVTRTLIGGHILHAARDWRVRELPHDFGDRIQWCACGCGFTPSW